MTGNRVGALRSGSVTGAWSTSPTGVALPSSALKRMDETLSLRGPGLNQQMRVRAQSTCINYTGGKRFQEMLSQVRKNPQSHHC